MKLNQAQRYALAMWLGKELGHFTPFDAAVIYDFDNFCDGKISEWRIITPLGIAGKLWNVDHLYITGASPHELSPGGYRDQQQLIDKWNDDIKTLMAIYAE